MDKNPVLTAKGVSAVIPKDHDGYCTVYKMDCADGLGFMTVYQVYPGIQLIYNDFKAASCCWDGNMNKNILEINHCQEGREGCRLASGFSLYLGEGDLSVHTMDNCAAEMSFPLKHYRGISVALNLEAVAENPPAYWQKAALTSCSSGKNSAWMGSALLCGQKTKLNTSFPNSIPYLTACKSPTFRLKYRSCFCFCIWWM